MQGNHIRFGLVLTYKCNLACEGCNRFLDICKWDDSDVQPEDLSEGYRRVVAAGLKVDKVRVTGGEPVLHPQFSECMQIISTTWNKNYSGRTCVFSNGVKPGPKPIANKWRYRVAPYITKTEHFNPPLISPYDLGMKPIVGIDKECRRQNGCGRLFDAFGFSFCIFAGAIGRMVGIDPYSPTPVLQGKEAICKHCVFSLGIKQAFRLFRQVNEGQLSYPTRSYKFAIENVKLYGDYKFKKFLER